MTIRYSTHGKYRKWIFILTMKQISEKAIEKVDSVLYRSPRSDRVNKEDIWKVLESRDIQETGLKLSKRYVRVAF